MKKEIKCVIGAGFGDEGKGLMVDYFCHKFDKNEQVVNVRFNGGFQAGHTVVRGDMRHIFHGFGAGSFNTNVITYFSEHCFFNGLSYLDEERVMRTKLYLEPKFVINEDTKISFYADLLINRAKERKNGANRDGSCGLGIYETFKRCQFPSYEITFKDVLAGKSCFVNKYCKIASKYWESLFDEYNISKEYLDADAEWNILQNCLGTIEVVGYDWLSKFDNIVFEGAQGLMLDMGNMPYYPHLTPSNTGSKNIESILNAHGIRDYNLEVVYVTRSYKTRHGKGFLNHEVEKEKLGEFIMDSTNVTNEFQGELRYGYLDMGELNSAILNDVGILKGKHGVAVTHLDQTDNKLLTSDGEMGVEDWNLLNTGRLRTLYLTSGWDFYRVKKIL